VDLRFYIDPESSEPHIYEHSVTEREVEQVLSGPGEDSPANGGARMKLGQTFAGRFLKIIYVPDESSESAFVITAYELRDKAKAAFRRRRRRKPR